MMSPNSVKYNQSTLELAKQYVSKISATGGTNIYTPFQLIYNQQQIPRYLTQIFAITDGHVSSRGAVTELISTKVKHSRTFALGIGSNVDRKLVEGMANAGGGTAEFVAHAEGIQAKILHQLKIALKPALLKPIRLS